MITGVTASQRIALAVALLLLVGLPLVAWRVGHWRRWRELQPGMEDDPWLEVLRRHRLSGEEMHRVVGHVGTSEQWPRPPLTDPVLRAAVVDVEQWHLHRAEARAARPGVLGLAARVVEAPMRWQYRRVIAAHGGSATPVRTRGRTP